MGKFTDKFMLRTIEVKGIDPEILKSGECLNPFNIVMHLATGMELNDIQSYELDKLLDYKNDVSCTAYIQKDGKHCDVVMTWGEVWNYDEYGEYVDSDVVCVPVRVTFR